MKTSYLFVLFFNYIALSQLVAQSYSIAAGTAYGDDIETLGFHTRAYYNFPSGKVCLGPEFTLFGNNEETAGDLTVETSLWELNFNAHFIFELSHKVGFYPVAGINFSHEREEFFMGNMLEEEETIEKWGINAGAGFHYILTPKFIAFTEWDHLFSDLSQNTFTIGIFYTFGKGFEMNGHEEEE